MPHDPDDSDLELPPGADDSDTDLVSADPIAKDLNRLRKGLAAQLQDALAALAIEQVANDNYRREAGDDPIGPERVYSGPELNQYRGQIRVSHWVGNGIQTMRQS